MCDMGQSHDHQHEGFGFLVDTPEIRTLIDETKKLTRTIRTDTPSISIHLLANDTACVWRHKFDPASGEVTPFRSGYVNAPCPPDSAT
jgi:hypothetical protein